MNSNSIGLCGINTAGLDEKAKDKLQSLVTINDNQAMIIPAGKDEQGRTVAEVMAYGKGGVEISFQEELLKSGLARTRQGSAECPNQITFENTQRMAVASKLGYGVRTNRICVKLRVVLKTKVD